MPRKANAPRSSDVDVVQRHTREYDIARTKLVATDDGILVDTLDVLSSDASVAWRFHWLIVDGENKAAYETRGHIGHFAVGQRAN